MTWALVFEHLFIVLASAILSVLIGLPLGIAAYAFPRLRGAVLRIVDLLQTIPSLALLGVLMVFFGAGKVTVIVGITLYSLLPIVRDTCLGLQEVDEGIKEAARGMGMSRGYRILRVEFPLAFPTVFTGIRIAVVNAIGSAVFAAFVGGGGLGSVINQGIRVQDMKLILTATAALMVIAVLLDCLMSAFERSIRKNRGGSRKLLLGAAAVALAFAALLPFGMKRSEGLILYDGDYSETQLMHHMVKLLVEDKTDLSVTILDQMSQVNNFRALVDGSCDLMISYDGTLLTTFLHLDPEDVPAGESIYDYANAVALERYDLRLLEKLGFDNTYAVAVPARIAEQYQLESISDLTAAAGQLRFGAEQGFFTQEGSMKFGPFTQFYGLDFQDAISVDQGLKYAAVEKGSFDVTVVYATDGLNRKAGLKILADDRGFFPDYNGAFLVRNDTFEKFRDEAPELETVLNLLADRISTEQMAELTYQVDVLGRSVDDAALDFLRTAGLLD